MDESYRLECMRIFFSIDLPKIAENEIVLQTQTLQQKLRNKYIRWTPKENIHLTLAFLGERNKYEIDSLIERLSVVEWSISKIPLVIMGYSIFPTVNRARGIWRMIDKNVALNQVYQSVNNFLIEFGFFQQIKPFNPHLTIARFGRKISKNRVKSIWSKINDNIQPQIVTTEISEINLMGSKLKPDGAEHQIIASFPVEV